MDMLQIKDGRVVDSAGSPVMLKGTCVGGWMNTENFINGYPGHESGLRRAMGHVLGNEKAQFFFDRLLDHFFTEDDVLFMKECGATVVRLPLNYRHFESDDKPFEYLEAGFRRLKDAVRFCEKHDLYVILDLHAVQGWQNFGWHCDNASRHTLFWRHPHFQDRFVRLWEEFARQFKGNAAVAGYNIMNEPISWKDDGPTATTPDTPYDRGMINTVYRRTVEAIRKIDPEHIIILEGDSYSTVFNYLDAPFADNLLYSSHQYLAPCINTGAYPGIFRGSQWDAGKIAQAFQASEGYQYMQKHNVPLWVGEFGAVFNIPEAEQEFRLQAMNDQIQAYQDTGVHWTTWNYKDVGVMGWAHIAGDSAFMQTIAPAYKAKIELDADSWMAWLPDTEARKAVKQLHEVLVRPIRDQVGDTWGNDGGLKHAVLADYAGSMLQPLFAEQFKGMSEEKIDQVLGSLQFKNCKVNDKLAGVIKNQLSAAAAITS